MKYQSFIMRVLCLLLIVGAVLGYNSMQKKDSDAEKDQQIASLTTRVEALEKQQEEALKITIRRDLESRAAEYRSQQIYEDTLKICL